MASRPSISRARRYDTGGATATGTVSPYISGWSAGTSPMNAAAIPAYTPESVVGASNAGIVPSSGLMNTYETGNYQLDRNTGALSGDTQNNLQGLAQRGLTIQGQQASTPAATGSVTNSTTVDPQTLAEQQALSSAAQPGQEGGADNGDGGYARGGMPRLADGGTGWIERRDTSGMSNPAGLINSQVGGRTDHIPMNVGAGSYVVPADVLSGIGQGNTLSGAHVMDHLLASGPYGTKLPNVKLHGNLPKPPHPPRLATGGSVGGVPVIVAGGEYLCSPEDVRHISGGDIQRGHKMLDEWVVRTRKKVVDHTKKLPGPVKS